MGLFGFGDDEKEEELFGYSETLDREVAEMKREHRGLYAKGIPDSGLSFEDQVLLGRALEGTEFLDPVVQRMLGTALHDDGQTMGEYERSRLALFPNPTGLGGTPSEYLSGWERAGAPGVYRHPVTGAIDYGSGVIVDPSTEDPNTGVQYAPDSTAPGSYRWLNAAAEMEPETVNRWRKTLRGLGYEVPVKGPWDQTLRTALDVYYRSYYFYGRVLPIEAASKSGTKQEVDAAYDPVLRRGDGRAIYVKLWGAEPNDEELHEMDTVLAKYTRRALLHNRSPEGARLRAKERFAEDFGDDPAVQKYQELDYENTELQESMLRAFTAVRALGT